MTVDWTARVAAIKDKHPPHRAEIALRVEAEALIRLESKLPKSVVRRIRIR